MNKLIIALILSLTNTAFSASLQCVDFAEVKSAENSEMSLNEFREMNSLIFTCKHKDNPKRETIQFGDGSGLISVEVEIKNETCIVLDISFGQDDQDFTDEDFEVSCLEE